MRSLILFASFAVFSTVLLAQAVPGPTPGLSIVTVVHEPTAADVGPFIAAMQIPNPFWSPDPGNPTEPGPNGEPQFKTAYGNGGGLSDELDSISPEFYALGNTTTHDLAVLLNETGADITLDTTQFALAGSRPSVVVPQAPEQSSPDGSAPSIIYTCDPVSIFVQNGAAVAIFVIATKWKDNLDTSPRDYIWTFTFRDTANSLLVVDAPLTVPKVGGSNPSGCVSSENGYPTGVWLVITGGLAGLVIRRKLIEKARA